MRACRHVQYACLRLHMCSCARLCLCVSVPQYQILLSQLSASLSLVVICLSTLATFNLSFCFTLLLPFSRVFRLHPSVLRPSAAPALSFLLHCSPVFFFFLPLSLSLMPSPSLPQSYSSPLFFLSVILNHPLCARFHLSVFSLKKSCPLFEK